LWCDEAKSTDKVRTAGRPYSKALQFEQAGLRLYIAGLVGEVVRGLCCCKGNSCDLTSAYCGMGRDFVLLRQAGQNESKVATDNWCEVDSWSSGRHCLKVMYIHIIPHFDVIAA